MTLYDISIWAALTGVILLICYALIKIVVKIELKKGLPNQIKTAQEYFNKKDIRLTLRIKSNGETECENFEVIKKPEYVG